MMLGVILHCIDKDHETKGNDVHLPYAGPFFSFTALQSPPHPPEQTPDCMSALKDPSEKHKHWYSGSPCLYMIIGGRMSWPTGKNSPVVKSWNYNLGNLDSIPCYVIDVLGDCVQVT